MAGVVTTSLVVTLGDTGGDDSLFNAEVDGRDDGLNNGNTSFQPGATIFILLFKTDDVTTLDAITSKGNLVKQGTSQYAVTGFAEFANETESSLSYPVPAGASLTTRWLGNNLGAFTIRNQSAIVLSTDKTALGDPFVGVLEYSYTAVATIYKLENTMITGAVPYEILCYWAGEVA